MIMRSNSKKRNWKLNPFPQTISKLQPKRGKSKENAKNTARLKSKPSQCSLKAKTITSYTQDKPNTQVMNQCTMTDKNDHVLRSEFDRAIDEVFKMLDLYSRNSINEANICPSNLPDGVLYFLGPVFHKIRLTRISYSSSQFQEECLKLFRSSSFADLEHFIGNVLGINSSKQLKQKSYSFDSLKKRRAWKDEIKEISFSRREANNFSQQVNPYSFVYSDENDDCKHAIAAHPKPKLTQIGEFENVAGRGNGRGKKRICFRELGNKKQVVMGNKGHFGEEKDKIGELARKLEHSIKKNQERIERSQNTRIKM